MLILVADVLALEDSAVMIHNEVYVLTIFQILTLFSALEQWAEQVPIHHNAPWAEKYLTLHLTLSPLHLLLEVVLCLACPIHCLSLSLRACR